MSDLYILSFIIISIMAVDLTSEVAGKGRIVPILSLLKTHLFAKFSNNPKKSVTHTHITQDIYM
jgi:hypothetical protein